MIDILSTDFIKRNEATVAWGKACGMFQMLPGLRGFWPMSSMDESGNTPDFSIQTRALSYNGNPTYNVAGLAPYIDFDGTGDYLSRNDEAGIDITGTETTIATALRGLTIGGWFWLDTISALTDHCLIGKFGAAAHRSYLLDVDSAAQSLFYVSGDGTALVSTGAALGVVSASQWYFLAGRFTPSTEIALFRNGVKVTTVAGIPASIFNSDEALAVGIYNGSNYLDGRASLCFLCAAALPDRLIQALYYHTRSLFGVV